MCGPNKSKGFDALIFNANIQIIQMTILKFHAERKLGACLFVCEPNKSKSFDALVFNADIQIIQMTIFKFHAKRSACLFTIFETVFCFEKQGEHVWFPGFFVLKNTERTLNLDNKNGSLRTQNWSSLCFQKLFSKRGTKHALTSQFHF